MYSIPSSDLTFDLNINGLISLCVRVNDAPVRGYEEDVGNKTTLRLFYPESASFNPNIHNDPDTLLVLVPFKQQDLRWLKEILYDEKRVSPSHLFFFLFFFKPVPDFPPISQ